MRALVFANGSLHNPESILSGIRADDLLIAADGGAYHLRKLNLLPHYAVGDFDSLDEADYAELENHGVNIYRHPERKNFTDLELALELAVQNGAQEILVFAALGNRWDQTLANLLLPAALKFLHVTIRLVDGEQQISLLSSGSVLEIQGYPGDTVSLIPIGGDATGITTFGLEYPLNQDTLYFGATRGISNVLTNNLAQINLEHGQLICIIIHQKK